ncbi:MAG TPA: hypothetical protein DHW70_00650 [Candidatus Atribacteria bacterium]|nr:hypothetical protein [Candidatus Atribacteria bacterium]
MKNKIGLRRGNNFPIAYYLAIKPLINIFECGDAGVIKEFEGKIFFALIDVLGHGREAHELAVIAQEFLEKNYNREPVEIIKSLHEHIRGSRGLVAGIGLMDLEKNLLKYSGVGNISLKICDSSSRNFKSIISRDGIMGYTISTPRLETVKFSEKEVIILYTDGIKEHFGLKSCTKLIDKDAKTIAIQIIQKFSRRSDDAACLVIKCKNIEEMD